MGIFRQFPYSNFHEMNMDEILKIVKTMNEEWDATKTEWNSYKEFIDNYFENLDVSQEVLDALRVFASDGTLNEIIDPVIAEAVTDWLDEHVTPTTPIVDNSLTIENAAAEASITGKLIRDNDKLASANSSTLSKFRTLLDNSNLLFERGGITFTDTPWTYYDSGINIRLHKGIMLHLNYGDIIHVESGVQFYLGGYDMTGTLVTVSWRSAELIVDKEGEYSILMRKDDQGYHNNDIDAIANKLSIIKKDPSIELEYIHKVNSVANINTYGIAEYDKNNIPWELGNITFDDEWVYSGSISRIRTKHPLYLHKNDFIVPIDPSISRYWVGWEDMNGELHYSGTNTNPYYVTEDGWYTILVRTEPVRYDENVFDDLINNFVIFNNSSYATETDLFTPRKTYTISHASGGTTNKVTPDGEGVPENSIQGCIASAKAGYYGVECDVRITSDKEWILCHDATVDRTTNGTGNVADKTLSELTNLNLKINGVVSEYKMPSIEEFIKTCCIWGVVPVIEIEYDANNVTKTAVQNIAKLLLKYGLERKSIVISFNVDVLEWIKQINRNIIVYRVCMTTVNPLESGNVKWLKYGNAGITFSQDNTDFTEEYINTMKSYGHRIASWTSYPTTREATIDAVNKIIDTMSCEQLPDVLTLLS